MTNNCLNINNPTVAKLLGRNALNSVSFHELEIANVYDLAFDPRENPGYQEFIENPIVRRELGLMRQVDIKNELNYSNKKNISFNELISLKSRISKKNNENYRNGINVKYSLYNVFQLGISDLYTWGIRRITEPLNVEAKLDRAKAKSEEHLEQQKKELKIGDDGQLKLFDQEQQIKSYEGKPEIRNISETLFNGKKEAKTTEVLENLIKTEPQLAPLAKYLLRLKSNNVTLRLISDFTLEKGKEKNIILGQYYPNTNSIELAEKTLNRKDKGLATILHEILHAYTYHELRINEELTNHLGEIYEYVQENLSKDESYYPMKNLDEFIVGLFTKSEFIKRISEIPARNSKFKNLLNEILDFFLSILNITKKDSIYSEALFVANQVLIEAQLRNEMLNEMYSTDMSMVAEQMFDIDQIQLESFQQEQLNREIQELNFKNPIVVQELYKTSSQKMPIGDFHREALDLTVALHEQGVSNQQILEMLKCL